MIDKNIAIYSRKSKYSDKSESIDSQIEFCKTFAKSKYGNNIDFTIYIDEGFSGGSIERPQYKNLLLDIKNGHLDVLICYKIDRISRSFIDFANLQEIIAKYKVNIISASEGFDTSTPWGTSVLNILMIFAQLERNNVSERVRDTMLYYAKQGRWTGGLTPTGFESKSINYIDNFGQQKKMVILFPIDEEIKVIKIVYERYLQLQSLNKLEKWLIQNNYMSKKDNYFSTATIRELLRNPVYVVADKDIYNYFITNGSEICNPKDEFTGEFSLMPYNRTDKKTLKDKPIDKWILAISHHKGIISSTEWIQVQNLLKTNSTVMPRTGTAKLGLFSGLIICSNCGSIMRVKNGRFKKETGLQEFYYVCSLKEKSHKDKCNTKNLIGYNVEKTVLNYIQELGNFIKAFNIKLESQNIVHSKNSDIELIKNLQNELKHKNESIQNLLFQLSQNSESTAGKYITYQIENLDTQINEIKNNINNINLESESEKIKISDIEIIKEALLNILMINKINDYNIKHKLINILIKSMLWDGNTLTIKFNSKIYEQTLQTFNNNRQSSNTSC